MLKKNSRGFTILEVLLAMTLFSIVMTSSYGIFSMGIQIWRRTQGASIVEREVLLAFERMGRDIRSTLRISENGLKAQGKGQEFELPVLIESFDEKKGEIYQYGLVSYFWDPVKQVLCVNKSAVGVSKQVTDDSQCRAIVSEVRSLNFEYWLSDGIGESYSWYNQFDATDGVPQAIRVELMLNPKIKGEKANVKREYTRTFLIPTGGVEILEEDTL